MFTITMSTNKTQGRMRTSGAAIGCKQARSPNLLTVQVEAQDLVAGDQRQRVDHAPAHKPVLQHRPASEAEQV